LSRRFRPCSARGLTIALAATVAVACGGDKLTVPLPCDAYTGGLLSGTLPGTYTLTSLCQGTKPELRPPEATGTVTIDQTTFTASVTMNGAPTTISGTYVTSAPDGITVDLSPLPVQFVGSYRLRNDTLAVSGAVGTQRLSLVGARQ
jgi:hypothetical protein